DLHVLLVDLGVDVLPGADRRALTHRRADEARGERGIVGELHATVRRVVVLVAGRGVVRGDVLTFGPVHGAGVQRGIDVFNADLETTTDRAAAARRAEEGVREEPGVRVDLPLRAKTALRAVESRAVGVGASGAELRAARAGARRADVPRQGEEA